MDPELKHPHEAGAWLSRLYLLLAAAALVLTLKTYVPAVDALLARAAAAVGETHAVQAFSELTRRLSGGEGVQQALSGSFEILTGGN